MLFWELTPLCFMECFMLLRLYPERLNQLLMLEVASLTLWNEVTLGSWSAGAG